MIKTQIRVFSMLLVLTIFFITDYLSMIPTQAATNLLNNPNFETGGLSPWRFFPAPGNNCAWTTQYPGAYSGSKMLSMQRPGNNLSCSSLSQDVNISAQSGEVYTLSFYGRQGWGGSPREGRLAIWALGGNQEVVSTIFSLGGIWKCVSTTLYVQHAGHLAIRAEVYLDSIGAPDYQVDSFALQYGTQGCSQSIPSLPNCSNVNPNNFAEPDLPIKLKQWFFNNPRRWNVEKPNIWRDSQTYFKASAISTGGFFRGYPISARTMGWFLLNPSGYPFISNTYIVYPLPDWMTLALLTPPDSAPKAMANDLKNEWQKIDAMRTKSINDGIIRYVIPSWLGDRWRWNGDYGNELGQAGNDDWAKAFSKTHWTYTVQIIPCINSNFQRDAKLFTKFYVIAPYIWPETDSESTFCPIKNIPATCVKQVDLHHLHTVGWAREFIARGSILMEGWRYK